MAKFFLLTLAVGLFSVAVASPPNLSPPVNTKNGVLIGHRVHCGGIDVYEFDAIPYGEPPVGGLRFKKTQPKQRWPNALLTISPPPACPQVIPSPFGPNFPGTQMLRLNTTLSEDCLYMSIWVPRVALDPLYYYNGDSINRTAPPANWPNLPVLVYFHGGAFTWGGDNNDVLNGTVLAAMNNIIVVTVQYRLGALGYFYTGTQEAPGNQGLWDQLEALKWINANIGVFGGNASQVTIWGQSAGGASVGFHLLSPYSRQFFQRAILNSGSGLSDFSVSTATEGLARSTKFAHLLASECNDAPVVPCPACAMNRMNGGMPQGGYPMNNMPQGGYPNMPQGGYPMNNMQQGGYANSRLSCLRSIDAMKIAQRQYEVLSLDDAGSAGIAPFPFVPVVDGDFIPRMPRDMLTANDFYNVSVLAGVNKNEGSYFVDITQQGLKFLPNPLVVNRSFDNFDRASYEGLIQSYFYFYPRNGIITYPVVQEGIRLIYEALTDDDDALAGRGVVDRVSAAVGDWAITCPTITWADYYADAPDDYRIKAYLYYFSQRSTQNPWPEWMGVVHGEELPFFFGLPFADYAAKMTYSEEEKMLSRVMMAYLSNFAKFGDPNRPDPSSRNQANSLSLRPWPQYDGTMGKMAANINIQARVRQEGDGNVYGLKRRECAFWNFLSRVHQAITVAKMCGREQADMVILADAWMTTTRRPGFSG